MPKTVVWSPAFNAQNRAIGEFKGIFSSVYQRRDGEEFEVEQAIFEVRGETGESKPIPIRLPGNYHPENDLGTLGSCLGFVYKPVYTTDKDGFQALESNNLSELDELIQSSEGENFTFSMERGPKGLWQIDIRSIKPR